MTTTPSLTTVCFYDIVYDSDAYGLTPPDVPRKLFWTVDRADDFDPDATGKDAISEIVGYDAVQFEWKVTG